MSGKYINANETNVNGNGGGAGKFINDNEKMDSVKTAYIKGKFINANSGKK